MTVADRDGLAGDGFGGALASRPVKRSFSIRGHRTSISLEAAFWDALVEIAGQRNLPLVQVVAGIDEARGDSGLSGAVRIFILAHYQRLARSVVTEDAQV